MEDNQKQFAFIPVKIILMCFLSLISDVPLPIYKNRNNKWFTLIAALGLFIGIFGFLQKDKFNKNMFCQLNPFEKLCNQVQNIKV